MKVILIAHTPDPEKIIATSAKLCYSSTDIEDISNNLTSKNIEYFVNMLNILRHESPLEHVTFTFAIEEISRALTHQLVRHRIASYSQQSQRYVKLDQFNYIIPPVIENNDELRTKFILHMMETQNLYDEIVNKLMSNGRTEKEAIEDARYIFPNACETKIIMTMNARSLLNFFAKRSCDRAQWEIRELSNLMLQKVQEIAPTLFKLAGPTCIREKCKEGSLSCGTSKLEKSL